MVITTDENNERVEYFTEKEIVRVCTNGNAKKYRQYYNTPMLQPPLRQDLGYLGFTQASDEI